MIQTNGGKDGTSIKICLVPAPSNTAEKASLRKKAFYLDHSTSCSLCFQGASGIQLKLTGKPHAITVCSFLCAF